MALAAVDRSLTTEVVIARSVEEITPVASSKDVGPRPAPTVAAYRRRRLVALLAAGATASLLAPAATRAAAAFRDVPASVSERRPVPASYVVQPGDTLWSIARRLEPEGDVRPLVDALVRSNGGSRLVAGQRLTLP